MVSTRTYASSRHDRQHWERAADATARALNFVDPPMAAREGNLDDNDDDDAELEERGEIFTWLPAPAPPRGQRPSRA
jgi:hypothetical protein